MSMIGAYERLAGCLFGVSRPFLSTLSRLEGAGGMWHGRLGHTAEGFASAGPHDLWIQAVSVGEVAVAEAIIAAIEKKAPALKVLVSSSTPAGYARALSSIGRRCPVIPYPLDFPQVVRRITAAVRPSVYACLEAELWPNLIRSVRRMGARTVLMNARISARSFPRYRMFRPVFRPVIAGFSRICAISEVHAARLAELGADRERIVVTGNAKYEGLLSRPSEARREALRKRLGIGEETPVLVAGSLRKGEERYLVQVSVHLKDRHPDLVIFLVPRHPKRVPSFVKALDSAGLGYQNWSSIEMEGVRKSDLVLVDVIGPLFDLYGLATAAFVGGSLVPKGGQNLMEPAAWGCPVISGPHTENFEEARRSLEGSGGGIFVEDIEEMESSLDGILRSRERRESMGQAARLALEGLSQGSATRQAEILLHVLGEAGLEA